MGNFTFVRETLPRLAAGCGRAESYATNDPTAACMWARRVAEDLVLHLYGVLDLPEAYRDDLAARINDAAFKSISGPGITQKLNLIRKLGNRAAHPNTPLRPRDGFDAVRELHHVMIWAAFHYSPHPEAVPTGTAFDPKLAAQAAPLTKAEVAQLAQRFTEEATDHAAAVAERDQKLTEQTTEIAALREQIAAARHAQTRTDTHDYTEAETRDAFIDLLLREAGWPLTGPDNLEYDVTGMPTASGIGRIDYMLWDHNGLPLGIVEAKRTTINPHAGEQQAKLYTDSLEQRFGQRPVIFYTNGYEHWIWDDAAGYPPRRISGFYTRDELQLAIARRTTRTPLSTAAINTAIAGRPYQTRAIRSVGDAFDRKQRTALLAMATGSGKTRIAIALADQLMKNNWAKRVLFLADRTALVRQTARAFTAELPTVTTLNLVEEKSADARVFVSTYPTMLGMINQTDGDERPFGPGFFDLIIIDEAHRSVYAKYGAIFDWFDGMLLGLTATPKNEVDHNTYRLFHLEDGVPTDAYTLEEAVADGYLVPPRGVSVGTTFLRSGIRYNDLTEVEKDQ